LVDFILVPQARVLYDYESQHEAEITISEGEVFISNYSLFVFVISNHSYRSYQSWSKEIRDGGGLLKYNTILDFKKYLFIILSFIFGSKNFRGRKSDGKEGMFPGNYVQLV